MKKTHSIFIYILAAVLLLAPAGNLAQAATRSDKTAPYVYIVSPLANQKISGSVTLKAYASDRSGIASVQFMIDGVNFGAADTLSPYAISLDTTKLVNGYHKISARALDKSGNTGVSTAVSVSVLNNVNPIPAPVCPTSPAFGASPNPITTGQSSTLSFGAISNATTCSIDNGVGSVSCAGASKTVSPTATTVYKLTATGSGGSVTCSKTLTVNTPPPTPAPVCPTSPAFGASPNTITSGQSATLSFGAIANASTCSIDNGVGSVSCAGASKTVSPTATTIYKLTATGTSGSAICSATLTVNTPPPPVINNLIQNPSLETADAALLPQFWFKGGWGSNQAVFSYPVAGYDGAAAAKIDMSSYVDGDAKWYFQDVAVGAEKNYTFTDFYQSTAPSTLTVRYTMNDNTVQYLEIANLDAAPGWQQVTKTIYAPYNIKSLTVFHLIRANGSLSVDDFSLSEVVVYGGFTQGFVSLNFDDGWTVTYENALPILNNSGLSSTQYIITGSFDDPEYVNETQTLAMQASGHEIGAHTKTHPDLTTLTQAKIEDEIAGSRNDLLAIGINSVLTFDYPYGTYNSTVESVVKNSGFIGARSVDTGYNTKTEDKYLLKAQSVEVNTTFAEVKSWIDTAVANKSWVILTFHDIDHSGDQYSSTPEMLQQIVNYLVAQKVPVKTNAEGITLMGQ